MTSPQAQVQEAVDKAKSIVVTKLPVEQASMIELLFGDEIKELKEKFKSWFIGEDDSKKKTKKPLIVKLEESKLDHDKSKVIEEYKYTLLVAEPLGDDVAKVEFTLKVRRDKI